jgi:hypothetical protein
MIDLPATFKKFDSYDYGYRQFENIDNPPTSRPDLCAFLLLDRLVPKTGQDILGSASHDEVYINVDCEALAEVATEDDVLTLVRCGVRYDDEHDSLCMFV